MAGNLLLSAAILLCGLTFTGIANLADVINLVMFGERYFYYLQKEYLYPQIVSCSTYKLRNATRGCH